MGFDTIRDLINMTEYTAKKMVRKTRIPIKYSYLSVFILPYTILAMFLNTEYEIYNSILLLLGFIGSTILTSYLIIAIYLFDQHIELTKYYYLNIRDLMKNIKNEHELENLYRAIEQLLLINKIGIEYSPVTIIPAYSSLLVLHEKMYVLVFMIVYIIVCSVVLREIIARFNAHIDKENLIENELSKITGISVRRHERLTYSKTLWFILSIITFSIITVYVLNKLYEKLDEHLTNHRSNYESFKTYVVRFANISY